VVPCIFRRALPVLLLTLFGPVVAAHQAVMPVIVDTDVALDDVRALGLILEARGLEVQALLTSDGGSTPCGGAARLARILAAFDRQEVPIGVGASLDAPGPPWRKRVRLLDRLLEVPARDCHQFAEAQDLAGEVLREPGPQITWVALGPLTNLAALLRAEPALRSRIRAVVYCGEEPEAPTPGWNTLRDPEAATAVFASGLPVYLLPPGEAETTLVLDAGLLESVAALESPAAQLIIRLHRDPEAARLIAKGHARAWDDVVALALVAPDAFRSRRVSEDPPVARLREAAPGLARQAFLDVLSGAAALEPRPSVVLDHYPMLPSELRPDVAAVAGEILQRHGREEWKAAVLTNEMHRHLGIYSLVGVKMGIRAREVLQASLDDLEVLSLAGSRPPVSCMTDGLQVSTGASLGRGTIRVEAGDPAPEAVFVKGDRRLRLGLRPSIRDRIRRDVEAAVQAYGGLTEAYFEEIRRLSIRYWLELDRREIFVETWDKEDAS